MYAKLMVAVLASLAAAAWAGDRGATDPAGMLEVDLGAGDLPLEGHPPVSGYLGDESNPSFGLPPGHPPVDGAYDGMYDEMYGDEPLSPPLPKRYSI